MARNARSSRTSRRTARARSAARAPQDPSAPKTTRADADRRREPERTLTAGERIGWKLDAMPDRVDIRDWFYQPRLGALPDRIVNCLFAPKVLDQGTEGACTEFALAAVINYLLRAQSIDRFVSPWMLYELARHYDEWPGEEYEGSSARGAMKAWVRHGVCTEQAWPATARAEARHPTRRHGALRERRGAWRPGARGPGAERPFQEAGWGSPEPRRRGKARGDARTREANTCRSESHGGFDNDPDTLNAVLWRILGGRPTRRFTLRDLQY